MNIIENRKTEHSHLSCPAAIYIAPSRCNDYGDCLDDHISKMRDYAQKNNIIIVKNYIVKRQSLEMVNFLYMVEAFMKNEFALLLLYSMDELARDYLECLFYQSLLLKTPMPVVCVEESPAPFNIKTDTLTKVINAYNHFFMRWELQQRIGTH